MQTVHHIDDWISIARSAWERGATLNRISVEWEVSGNCRDPIYREIIGVDPDPIWFGPKDQARRMFARGAKSHNGSRRIELWVRCRKCPECRLAKAIHWRKRAEAELSATLGRTWFGTLTLSSHAHAIASFTAQARLDAAGTKWRDLDEAERFKETVKVIYEDIQLWLKRVRKSCEGRLRFLCVTERHKSGLPHFHVLVHETTGEAVRHAALTKAWHLGFTNFKLLDAASGPKAVGYVVKYLTKAVAARVRASAAYGIGAHYVAKACLQAAIKKNDPERKTPFFGGLINGDNVSGSETLGRPPGHSGAAPTPALAVGQSCSVWGSDTTIPPVHKAKLAAHALWKSDPASLAVRRSGTDPPIAPPRAGGNSCSRTVAMVDE